MQGRPFPSCVRAGGKEARARARAVGFRPGRSCHDAIRANYAAIDKKEKYVVLAIEKDVSMKSTTKSSGGKQSAFPRMRRQFGVVSESVPDQQDEFLFPEEGKEHFCTLTYGRRKHSH